MSDRAEDTDFKAWHAVADLYHAYFTGLIMSLVTRRSTADAAEFVFRVFRRQHHERFLAGIEKFGLTNAPHAVAAAQYHYLSNQIGGVNVEYMRESDRKAWIRYPPPRWVWRGTAICAIPGEVSAAMLRGWHAHNGVSFKNPRMGFVCTKQTVDGQNGLEGFYYEYDRDLLPDERLVFARHLEAPLFDPAAAPKLATDTWPRARLEKAYRNYAMEYVRSSLPVIVNQFSPSDAGHLLYLTGKLVGMQFYPDIAASFPVAHDSGPEGFGAFLLEFLRAEGDEADLRQASGQVTISQKQWSLIAGVPDYHPMCLQALAGLIEGLMTAHDRRLSLNFSAQSDRAPGPLTWTITQKPLAATDDGRFPP
ncbi:MAG: hypothetical protein IJ127_17115 [Afipia sp.]|jgi:hypothetical protein|nr:hypothetical protein [Afipia sp.]MBS4005438.1 hypothetical protein [Afipia sp.]WIG52581.1 MAG: hypothetical protein OJF48_003500 [Afipia sp.]